MEINDFRFCMTRLRNILDPEKGPGPYQAILETAYTALTLGWYNVGQCG